MCDLIYNVSYRASNKVNDSAIPLASVTVVLTNYEFNVLKRTYLSDSVIYRVAQKK